jgi:hypothetical protein
MPKRSSKELLNKRSSKELLDRMRQGIAEMETILRNPHLSAAVKIEDINFWCWALIQELHSLQAAVRAQLSDTELQIISAHFCARRWAAVRGPLRR